MIVGRPQVIPQMSQSSANENLVMVRLRLIGQMEAWTLTSDSILPTGRKTRALLAILALAAPRPVLRGRLAEMLWSRRPEEQARASLRQEIHRLLEATHPVGTQILNINRDHLSLRPGTVWVDVEEVLRATPTKPASLSLLDSDLLEDLDGLDPSFDAWLAAERERVRDRARELAESLLHEKGDPETVIPAAQQLLAIDRTHEGAWRTLMRAYTTRGERGMAIQAYDRCRAVLNDLLDAQPSEETQKLLAEIRASSPLPRPEPRPDARQPDARQDVRPDGRPDARPDARAEPRPLNRAEAKLEFGRTDRNGAVEMRPAAPRGGSRVGVLPLLLSGASEDDSHLSTGLADEITAGLARFRWMSLVSSTSLARYATQTRDETAIRRAFGIDFLLDGTIQRIGPQLRISLKLLDLRANNQLVWSRRFDRDGKDLMSLQDDIAAEVVAQIDPEILLIEAQRVTARPVSDPSAYDLVLRSLPMLTRLEQAQFMEAGNLLRQALAIEPDYPAAYAWYAFWHLFLVGQSWTQERGSALLEAERVADRAISLDPQDAKALSIAGHVRAFLQHRVHDGLALQDRALTVNPNLPMAWGFSGAAKCYAGEFDDAERRLNRYKRLSPLDPHGFMFDTGFTMVALLKHEFLAAVDYGRKASQLNLSFSSALKPYLAALGHLGASAELERVRTQLQKLEPGFTITGFASGSPFTRQQDTDLFCEGLRLAGLP